MCKLGDPIFSVKDGACACTSRLFSLLHIRYIFERRNKFKVYIKKKFKTLRQHSGFWTEYFGETILRPQRADPLPELTVGGVLEFGASRSKSYIFESSRPVPIKGGLVSYEISLSYFARYQFIPSAKNLDVVQIRLVASFLVMFSYCIEIVGNFVPLYVLRQVS